MSRSQLKSGATEIDNTTRVLAVIKGITMDKVDQVGDIVRDAMKEEVPVRSGALKKSIRVRRYEETLSLKVLAGNTKAFYVHFVILGTARTPRHHATRANNFMQRALDKSKSEIKRIFSTEVTVSG